MSEIWPYDINRRIRNNNINRLRKFKCVLLTPFESRFNTISESIKNQFNTIYDRYPGVLGFNLLSAEIKRLDWITSAGVIQNEIWDEIINADLIICDITGYNPNVLFESGVASALKSLPQVIFIRDHYFKQQSPFDLAPIRYAEYALTSDELPKFLEKIDNLILQAFIRFPDSNIDSKQIYIPANINFNGNHDDLRIYTPPFSHRRISDNSLEFGSIIVFTESWASIGNHQIQFFKLSFEGSFSNISKEEAWIGVGLRSQHPFANFGHVVYLLNTGSIIITEPNEEPPNYYRDNVLREKTQINLSIFHKFEILFSMDILDITIDDFSTQMKLENLPKVFGPGLIRFQSWNSRMKIKNISVSEIN